MEIIEKYRWPIFFGAAVILLGVLIGAGNSGQKANDTNKNDAKASTSQQKQAEETKKKAAEKAKAEAAKTGEVTYTARLGDSYTVLARKAVQAYAHDTKVTLKPAQIVAAETHLTVGADSPYLNYGQKVTYDKAVVAKAVAGAQALSATELAAWQAYVPYVVFDTSHNG